MNDVRPSPGAAPPPATVAAVDLGSNSFHMVIARFVDGDPEILDRLREPVRLAAGLDDRKRLSTEAKDRALAALERLGQRLRDLPPTAVRAVGTSTLRRASADLAFRDAARRALGHPIEIISGQEEARLIWQGIFATTPGEGGPRLAVDIGGGSTEIMVGDGADLRHAESLPMGCVESSRRFFADGIIDRERFRQAEIAAAVEMRSVRRRIRDQGWGDAVGSSGTIHAISEIGRHFDGNGPEITLARLKRLRRALIEAGSTRDLALESLKADRAPVLPGGLAILLGVFKCLEIESMTPASGALREGVLFDLVGRLTNRDVRDRTVGRFVDRFHVDVAQADRVRTTALALLDDAGDAVRVDRDYARKLLSWAALLHEIGLVVGHSGYQKHGEYLAANTDLPGFSADDQEILATLIRGHRRKIPRESIDALPEAVRDGVLDLIVLLRIAVLLHRNRSDRTSLAPRLARKNDRWKLRLPAGWLDEHPLTQADLERQVQRLEAVGLELVVGEVKPA